MTDIERRLNRMAGQGSSVWERLEQMSRVEEHEEEQVSREPQRRTVKSAPPAALPESKGKKLTLPKAKEITNPLTTPAKSGFFEGVSLLPSSPKQAARDFAYTTERAAAALLGAGEGVTDFIGTTFYKGLEGLLSLGGVGPNANSEWAGRQADAFLENSITRDYEESIRRRYNPSQGAENVTGIGQAIVQMLPGIGASKVVSAAGKGLNAAQAISRGENVGRALFGLQAAGNSASQAKAEGADTGQALAFGAASGALETAIEGIAGGIPGLGGGKVGKIAEAVKASPLVSRALDIAGEGGEEALSTVLTPYLQRAIYDPDAPNATPEEIAQSALMGAVAAGVLQGGLELPGTISDIYSTRRSIGSNAEIAARAGERLSTPAYRDVADNPLATMLPTGEEALAGKRVYLPGSTAYQRSAVDNPSGAVYDGGTQNIRTGGVNDGGRETAAPELQGVYAADVRGGDQRTYTGGEGASSQTDGRENRETAEWADGGVTHERRQASDLGTGRGGTIRLQAEEAGIHGGRDGQIPETAGAVYRGESGAAGQARIGEWARGHIVENPSSPAVNRALGQAKAYTPDAVVVEDSVIKAHRPNTLGLTSDGVIYLSDAIPEELSAVVPNHEIIHALKQRGNEAYRSFVDTVGERIAYTGDPTGVLDVVIESRYPGKTLFDLSMEELDTVYDELNALVWGYYKADQENARAQFAGVFQDYDSYIRELDAIMEGARQPVDNQTGVGPTQAQGPESSVGAEYGPNTVGAAESRHPYRQKNSRVGTNTFSKMYRDLLNEIQADGGNITELPYDVVTEAQSLEHAQQRLFLDLEGEIADLPKREAWSGEDLDTAMGILDRYMEEARESRDYTKANEWARLIQSKGTTGGQMIQAFAKYSRTPQGILVNAVEALDRSRLTDGEKAQVLDHVQTQVEELDALRDGDKDSVIALIKENSRIRRTGSFFRNRIGRVLDRALQADSYDHLKRVAAAQVDSIAKDYQYKSRAEAAKNLRTMFMLSNLTTVLRNIVSNGVFGGLDSFAGSTAGVPLDILLSKRTGTRSVAAENPLSSQARKGMADGALKSYIEVALDADASGAENRYEHTSSRTFKMAGNPLERFFSTWDKYIGYALTTTDELAKGGVRAETQRGIDQLKERGLIRRMENGKWAADSSLDSRGEEMAKYRTFQDDTSLSRGLLTLRRGANQMIGVEGFGAGDLLAPFARVPANLVTRSVEYSPLGLANGAREVVDVLRKAHSGTLTAAEQARAVSDVSRGLTGSGLIAVFGALAAAGILRVAGNGEGEEDKTALETSEGITGTQLNLSAAMRWLSKGGPLNLLRRGDEPEPLEWQEGDTVISIGFLEPINAQMTTGALLAQELRDTPEAGLGQRLETYGRASLEGTLQSLLNLPAMSSLQDLANGYTYSEAETTGGRVADALISYGASQASSFIPNFMRAAARASDPYVRDTYSSGGIMGDTVDSLKAGIPGLRQTLPIRKTPFGENRTYGDNQWLNAANALILPGGLTTYRTSDAAQELYRLPAVDGYPVYPARNAPGKVSYKGKEYELTAEQKSQWQTTYGQSYQRYIDELGGNAYYQSLPPEEKTKLVSGARSYASDLARRELIEGQGTQYQSSDWEKAYQAEQDGVPIDIWLSYRDVRNKLENSTDKTVSRNANQAVRQMIFEDQSLTKEQKATLDAYLFNDVTVIPKDIDVDYSSREAFQISQMSESAQERWPDIRDRFGLTPEEYQEALRIYSMDKDDGVNVSDKKRMLRERFGPSGNAIYTALGRKAE